MWCADFLSTGLLDHRIARLGFCRRSNRILRQLDTHSRHGAVAVVVAAQSRYWVELPFELSLFVFGIHLDHDGLRAEDRVLHLQPAAAVEGQSAFVAREAGQNV